MDKAPELNSKQYIQMINLFNNGYTLNKSIFPNLYVFRHANVSVVDKVLLIDRTTMEFYSCLND